MYLTHGMTKSPEYAAWRNLVARCTNPSNPGWLRYGGRGITVCDAWKGDFNAFFDHVGRRPSRLHSLDRIDNSRGYEPGNVRWVTRKHQQRNMRSNVFLTHNGETRCLADWAEHLGLNRSVVKNRYEKGWATADVLRKTKWKHREEVKSGAAR